MNKLGFYIENSTVQYMRDALQKVKPPVILMHAGDRGLMQEIRRGLAPDAFIIGRMFIEQGVQESWLDSPDPAERGRAMADSIINYDFGYSLEKGLNGRLLIDAWMSLNETLAGPASFGSGPDAAAKRSLFERRAPALDKFQVAFRAQLQSRGLEAVAFNFAAGNYIEPDHYLKWFPKTLEAYVYLGFHEYGWPHLNPAIGGVSSGALYYRRCLEEINKRYNNRHKVIITEAGLARGYKYRESEDVGWLYPADTISEAGYWDAINWYNTELCKDPHVLGACLYEVGHAGGRWESFRHLGQNNRSEPILLIDRIVKLREGDGGGGGGGGGGDGDGGGGGGGGGGDGGGGDEGDRGSGVAGPGCAAKTRRRSQNRPGAGQPTACESP